MIDEPQSTAVWQQGGKGEARVGERLAKHLDGHHVRLLHDRRIPGHGHANIDHLAIGVGGITVVDTKTHHDKIHVDRVGGLFAPRRSVLLIGGRDQTQLVDAVEHQIELARTALARSGEEDIDVCGPLCFAEVEGLPLLGQLSVRGIIVDGPKPVAKLARRSGHLRPEAVERIWRHLARSFPQA